jgi:hypothetical protein
MTMKHYYTVGSAISKRTIAACLAAVFVLSSLPAEAAQQATSPSEATSEQQQSGSPTGSGGTRRSDEALPDTPVPSEVGGAQSSAPAGRKQQNGAAPQQPAQQPAGTAAAGIENTAGVAASKPAGVAIAPPKQRRVRLLIVKVGAIVGAGAALGTVAALSKGSPSKPPGAH